MALSQKHRSALYEAFLPQLGEDVTEAFLSEFPTGAGEEPVTKTFLRAELAELRTEMHQLHNRTITAVIGAMAAMTAILAVVN